MWAALKSNGIFAHGGMVAQARCSIRHEGLGSRLPLPRFPLHGRVVGGTYCRKIFAVTLTQSLMFAGPEILKFVILLLPQIETVAAVPHTTVASPPGRRLSCSQ